MKAQAGMQGSITLALSLLTTVAMAQSEQWLQYRTTREPQGYRWIDLTNTPPPDVVWPKLSTNAHYGQWKTTLDPKGVRWICVDRSTKSGPCDRLYIDSNGNGRLDDETVLKAKQRDEYMSYFDPARLSFKGEDGPLTYHLVCRFYQFGTNRAQLLVGSGGVYEGKVNMGGKKRTLRLVDNTVNGVYNDSSMNASESDMVVIDGQENTSRYLGKFLEVDKELFRIEVAPDGAFVKIQPAGKVATGQVRVPEVISEFTAIGLNGHFVRKPVKGEFTLPVGTYRVNGWTIDRKDAQGASWQLSGYSFGEFAQFEVAAAQAASLTIGEPVSAVLQAMPVKNEVTFNLRFYGSLGESIQFTKGGETPPAPLLKMASATGSLRTTNNFQFG